MSNPVRNPYAKKKSAPSADSQQPRSSNASSLDRVFDGAPKAPRMASFSQAFPEEATDHEPPPPTAELTDRDHHAYTNQPHVLYISTKQKGNPVLSFIRNVPTAFQRMVPDFLFANTSCGLFLSLKYHNLYPQYILNRMAALRDDFVLRILLVLVDVEDNNTVINYLNCQCVKHNFTLILCFSEQEAARYLETYKALKDRDASTIQKSKDSHTFVDQVVDVLTTTKLTKTDAQSLLGQLDSVRNMAAASPDELSLTSGMGTVKVKSLYDALHKPFSAKLARERRDKRLREKELAQRDDSNEMAEGKDEEEKHVDGAVVDEAV